MSKSVVAFAASISRQSINKRLVKWACGLLKNAEVEILDLNDYELPLFSVDREAELGRPPLAEAFLRKLTDCDGVVISFAEHNGAYTAAYKNLYDWVSRIQPKVYRDKPMVLLSTSPGGRGAKSVMDLALSQIPRFGGAVRASVSVPLFRENFDIEAGAISNPDIAAEIEDAISKLFAE
ncbi:MAG: NAD(P)H-dependent oxidoreductase [Pseudomonadota bacterium]